MIQQLIIQMIVWFNKAQALAWWILCKLIGLLESVFNLLVKFLGAKVMAVIMTAYIGATVVFAYVVMNYQVTLTKAYTTVATASHVAWETRDLWLK